MNYEDFKEQFVEDVKDRLYEQGSEVNIALNEVNKLNEYYDAMSVTPEGANIGVNIRIDTFYEATQNGASYDEAVDKAVEMVSKGLENKPDIDVATLTDYSRMAEEAYVPMPFADINNAMLKGLDINNVKVGDTFRPQEEVRLKMDTMTDVNGDLWIPLFFNEKALNKGETANVIIPVALYDVLKIGLDRDDVKGVVVDPFGKPFVLSKDLLTKYLSDFMAWAEQNGIQVPGRNSMDYRGPEVTTKKEEN